MDLSLSEAEQQLADSVRSFVSRSAPTSELVKLQSSESGYAPEWTATMADAGWLGALVPAEVGGAGATCLQAALIWEELGRAPLPGPFLASSAISAALLAAAEPSDQRDEALAAIADGAAIVAPVLAAHGQEWNGLASGAPVTTGAAVTGTFPFVPYGRAASHFLVPVARPAAGSGDEVGLAVIPARTAGIQVRSMAGFLARSDEVSFTSVALEQNVVRIRGDAMRHALSRAYVMAAAYSVGGCQALLERCVDYSNTRKQFGTLIGRFQRVQDHIVELVNALDAARWAMYGALWRLDSGQDARASCHMARAVAAEAYITCTDAAHKVHGGIGVDPGYGLTLYTQQARSLYSLIGNPRWHKRAMADALGWTERSS